MFCKYCGQYVEFKKGICPKCGKPVEGASLNKKEYQEVASNGWVALSIFIPLLGFILAIACAKHKQSLAKKALIGAIIGLVLCVILCGALYHSGFLEILEDLTPESPWLFYLNQKK